MSYVYQIYSGKQSFVQAKQHIFNALSSYYYAIKKGYKSCLCDELVCKLIEKAKEITKAVNQIVEKMSIDLI